MRLSVKISRLSNFLFFLQKIGGLNLQKYLVAKNIDQLLFGENESIIWGQIKKSIGKQGIKRLQKNVSVLKSTFAPYWRKESKNLLLWKKFFQSNQSLFQQAIFDIKNLSGVTRFTISKIPIYLISDPLYNDKEIHMWFSWSPNKSFIVVEVASSSETPNRLSAISILAHEFFHLILRGNKNLLSQINKIAEENKKILTKLSIGISPRMFLEELLISSFIPEGYLGKKHFSNKINICRTIKNSNNLLEWRRFIAYKLKQTAKKYVNEAKQIDEQYLIALMKVIRQEIK